MPTQRVTDIEIDEVSLVDRPANPYASVLIAKRAEQEEAVAEEYFDADGKPVDVETLELGDVVQDAKGELFRRPTPEEIEQDEQDEQAETDERELASVGKSAFLEPAAVSKSVLDGIREQLSKAVNDEARDTVIAKALGALEKRAIEAEQRTVRLEQVAKAERDLRLEREYISKAANYNVPIPADELGPVLMRCAEALPYADCAVLHKALTSAGEMLFVEAGYDGQAGQSDPFGVIDEYLDEQVSKSDNKIDKAHAVTGYFDNDPDAYAAYKAERNNR